MTVLCQEEGAGRLKSRQQRRKTRLRGFGLESPQGNFALLLPRFYSPGILFSFTATLHFSHSSYVRCAA